MADSVSELFWKLDAGIRRRLEAHVQRFSAATEAFIHQLLRDGMLRDWRSRLTEHLDYWREQPPGFIVKNPEVLEAYIVSWADARHLFVDEEIRNEVAETLTKWKMQRAEASPATKSHAVNDEIPAPEGIRSKHGLVETAEIAGKAFLAGVTQLAAAAQLAANDEQRPPRLPKSDGHWEGTPGNGHWIPEKPIEIPAGRKVTRIPYVDGLPVFDEWEHKIGGKPADVLIALTGEQRFDHEEALKAWKYKFPGENFPVGHQFHHDLNATQFITSDGKQVFVARMQLVPVELNDVPHFGAAGAARRYTLDKGLARLVNQQAREGKGVLKGAESKLRRMLAKKIKQAGRLLPIVGGVFVLIDFAENAEAHGIGGAIVRATPLLGDVVTAYDAGSEFAAAISEEAKTEIEAAYRDANVPVEKAHADAREETVRALNVIAQDVRVTKYVDENGLVDAMKEPLGEFYSEMLIAFLRLRRGLAITRPSDAEPTETAIDARIRTATQKLKQELRERLSKQETEGPAA